MFSWKVNHYLYFLSEENEVRRDALDSEIELKQQIQPFINVVTYTTIIRTWETCLTPNGHKRTRNPWTVGSCWSELFTRFWNRSGPYLVQSENFKIWTGFGPLIPESKSDRSPESTLKFP